MSSMILIIKILGIFMKELNICILMINPLLFANSYFDFLLNLKKNLSWGLNLICLQNHQRLYCNGN